MKKLFLFLTLLLAGVTVNAQLTPSNNLNYVKLLKVPPVGSVEDSVLVYDGSDSFIKMRSASSMPISTATQTALNTLKASIPESYSKIVYVNATNPNEATIFDLNNPPVTNDNLLKSDVNNLYIDTDASTWVYNVATLNYVTKTVTSATSNFYLFGTTTDAGNNKTAAIERNGSIQATSFIKTGIAPTNALLAGGSTLANPVSGSGTIGFLPKYETAGILKNSLFYEEGSSAGINTTTLYTFGAGTSIFNVQNTAGSGFATQVNNNAAMVMRSNATLSALIETRNLPLVLNTNNAERIRIHASGGVSIGNLTDPGAKNLSVTGNIIDAKLTGNPTAPTPTAGDNDTSIATTAFVQANSRPYKSYVALLNQVGVSNPVPIVLENSLSGAIVWSRSSAGVYNGVLSGTFSGTKTVCFSEFGDYALVTETSRLYALDANTVQLATNVAGVATDGLTQNMSVEIRVYP